MDFLFARVLLHFACFRTWWGGVGWWGRIIHAWVARGRGQGRWDRVGWGVRVRWGGMGWG